MDWLLFEQLDRMRQAQGRMLETMGLRAIESPYRIVHREPGIALRRYDGASESGPLVLIVPAPIKRPYIWDLLPRASVVRRCLERGARVHLIDWQPAPPHYGLAQYAERLIRACLDAVRGERAIVLAHSLGGLLAAIFAALHPDRVLGLGLLAAPLHFGADTPVLEAMVKELDPDALPDALPGSFLSLASVHAAPAVFGEERLLDAVLSAGDPESLHTHLLVERWATDEFALPRRFVAELAVQLMREDRFLRGKLEIEGQPALPGRVVSPLLCVLDPRCTLVPPAAMLPFVHAAASRDKTVLHYEREVGVGLQHLGPLVGRQAHARLWPRVLDWIEKLAGHRAFA